MLVFQFELPDCTQTKAIRDLLKYKSLFLSLVFLSSPSHSSGMIFTNYTSTHECSARTEAKFIIFSAGRFELALTKLGQTIGEAPSPCLHCQPGLASSGQCKVDGGCTTNSNFPKCHAMRPLSCVQEAQETQNCLTFPPHNLSG